MLVAFQSALIDRLSENIPVDLKMRCPRRACAPGSFFFWFKGGVTSANRPLQTLALVAAYVRNALRLADTGGFS